MRIITLIHGTWGRGARWTQEGSLLVLALKAADPEARIKRLEWSGGNSHKARLEAAEKLVNHAKACRKRDPAAEHYVIAHSHAGNVVRYALSVEEVATDLRGVICLSTPFIICLRKPESKELWQRFGMLFFFGYFLFRSVIKNPDIHFSGVSRTLGEVLLPVFPLLYVVIVIVFFVLVARLGPGIYGRWMGISGRWFLDSFEGASLSSADFLIIRPSGDEADMGIKVSQSLAWLSNRPVRWVDRLYLDKAKFVSFFFGMNPKLRLAVTAVMVAGLSVFSRGWAPQLMKDTSNAGGRLLYLGAVTIMLLFGGLTLCFLGAAAGYHPEKVKFSSGVTVDMAAPYELFAIICNGALGLLFFPLIATTSLLTVAFGWDMPFFSLFLQFTVEPLPQGKFSVFQLPPETAPLSHSLPYNNPAAIAEIIRWMKRDQLEPA